MTVSKVKWNMVRRRFASECTATSDTIIVARVIVVPDGTALIGPSDRLVFGVQCLLDTHFLIVTTTFRPEGHNSFDQILFKRGHHSLTILNTWCKEFISWVERGRVKLDLAIHYCEPTDHGFLGSHLLRSTIEEGPAELSVDLAFLIAEMRYLWSWLHQNEAWVYVPAYFFLSIVITDVVHDEAGDLSSPR